jgi:hypothetical protein
MTTPRAIDPRRTRKALRRVAKLTGAAESLDAPADFSGWEAQFLSEVGQRLTTYGSAFANLAKGRAEEALSNLQAVKLKEIEAKAKGKTRRGLRRKKKAATNVTVARHLVED